MAEQGFDLWLEFEVWEPKEDDDPEDDCFNMSIKLADGREYALNVWTFKFLARAVQECRESGEHLRGAYLEVPDQRRMAGSTATGFAPFGGIENPRDR